MLEQILRRLENEEISPEQVDEIKDGVEYYLEDNQEPDFLEDEELYETLGVALSSPSAPSVTVTERPEPEPVPVQEAPALIQPMNLPTLKTEVFQTQT